MQQYFAKNKDLKLSEDDYYHIKNVMRMKKGDLIRILFEDNLHICKIKSIDKEVDVEILDKIKIQKEKINIISAFSLIKEQKQDYLLQKGTEVGIDEFIPFKSKRSIIKINNGKDNKKIDRWQRIIKEAAEQSYRGYIPEIKPIVSFKDLVKIDADLKILFTLNEKTKKIKKVLQNVNKCDTILLVTGPEGGFDKDEEEFLINNGFISVSLGDNVLRSETAPIVATSIINYEFER